MHDFIHDFQKLLQQQPRYNVKHVLAENSEYADTVVKSGNCYYSYCVFYCDHVYYGRYSRNCNTCSGVTFCVQCEYCVECVDCHNSNGLAYCQDCKDSHGLWYCKDCYSCEDCIGCVNLSKKKYCIFNVQYSKEEFEEKKKSLKLSNTSVIEHIRTHLSVLERQLPRLCSHQVMTENTIGEHLANAKDCYHCYDAFMLENVTYGIECNGIKDSSDISVCFETEHSAHCVQAPLNSNCAFLIHSDNCSTSQFCAFSQSLTDCFGCVYLSHKKYHILNQPYSKEEYFARVREIKKELAQKNMYNMKLFFVSEYEQRRQQSEPDSVVFVDPK